MSHDSNVNKHTFIVLDLLSDVKSFLIGHIPELFTPGQDVNNLLLTQ